MVYYNENDRFAAEWLRNLIKSGHIADGDVDDRSIEQVQPEDLRGYTQCHFFAGIGGWSYALRCAEWPDDRPVWTGSCPCQPFSAAGERRKFKDKRHLWPEQYRLIDQCEPECFLGEQVASKDALVWFDLVYSDLERAGYSVGQKNLCAAGVGAPQPRQRIYFVGHSKRKRLPRLVENSRLLSPKKTAQSECRDQVSRAWRQLETSPTNIPSLNGIPLWLAREFLRCYGNSIVPQVAQAFIEAYIECS